MTRRPTSHPTSAPVALAPAPASAPGLVAIDWVAHRLSVPRSWVYARCFTGDFPHIRVGRYYRFEPAAVEAYITAHRQHGRTR